MTPMSTTLEQSNAERERHADDRAVYARMKHFVEKWTTSMGLNKRDSAELMADLTLVMQAVHRDASRETHALLSKALMAMPAPSITLQKD
jgi:hypothetical protein